MTTQISEIASFGKLTGHGVTLVGTDLVRILEESLPARFGGAPGDYQLVEREAGSQTQILLRVSPRVGVSAETEVKEYFLKQVCSHFGGAMASRLWRHAEALDVIVEEPTATSSGKIWPLRLLGEGGQRSNAS